MSPQPNVRGQAVAVLVLGLATAVFGSALAAAIIAVAAGLLATSLWARYQHDLRVAGVREVPMRRSRLDVLVAGDVRATLGIVASSAITMHVASASPVDLGVARVSWILLGAGAAVVYLSSLVDWYVILPRISGLLGVRPCRQPKHRFATFPRTWRQTTQWWYVHRIIAAVATRYTVGFAISYSVVEFIDVPRGSAIVGGVVMGLLASYLVAALRTSRHLVMDGGHPTLILGATVRIRDTEPKPFVVPLGRRRLRIPSWRRSPAGPPGPREYVFDVSLEGVQLVDAASREGELPLDDVGQLQFEDQPRKLKHLHLHEAKPAKRPFSGCQTRCSGINWYCIENAKCFDPK